MLKVGKCYRCQRLFQASMPESSVGGNRAAIVTNQGTVPVELCDPCKGTLVAQQEAARRELQFAQYPLPPKP